VRKTRNVHNLGSKPGFSTFQQGRCNELHFSQIVSMMGTNQIQELRSDPLVSGNTLMLKNV